ncbi:MAG: zinc-binding dehydrogenase, partial [Chloroflexi bacterium]|nr:zinc-binding dehydrogenase [Chloroflexota bacterium]
YQAFSRKNATVHFVLVYSEPEAAKQQAVDDVAKATADGALTHPIAAVMPLDDIAAAHELQESNTAIGNIVLDLSR